MRKLKLQMQISVDGYVAGPKGEMDWMTWNWGDDIKAYVNALTEPVDTILLGKNMSDGFITHWQNAALDSSTEEYPFAKKMCDAHKVVFSKSLAQNDPMIAQWQRTRIASGDMTDEVMNIKNDSGGDIIVYGGASFVSSLIAQNLIDELNLFVNPCAIGNGLPIFNQTTHLELNLSREFECGIVLHQYKIKA